MDEETTSFASRAMAEGKEPQMPSGMPYHRSLPHSWLNSLSARVLGLNEEISYRLPGAILGIITAPLIFVLARPYVGTTAAFVAALLLALSEWHIIVSRQARMYAPFLFFYCAAVFSILRWSQKDELKYFVASAVLFILAASFHNLGVFAALIPLIALFIKGFAKTPHYKLIIFSVVGGVSAYFYGEMFVGSPYREWVDAYGIVKSDAVSGKSLLRHLPTIGLLTAPGVLGLILGVWLGRNSKFQDTDNGREFRSVARYLLAVLLGLFASTGHLHAAFLSALLLMLLYPGPLDDYLKQVYKPLIAISVIALITAIVSISELGIIPGIKSLLSFPFPYWLMFNTLSPGITLLFISAMVYLAVIKKNAGNYGTLVLLICGLFPLIVVGIFKQWAPSRYLLEAYPFMLITGAYVLQLFISRFFRRLSHGQQVPVAVILSLIGLSGVLGGHGLIQAYGSATVQHGETLNEAAFGFPLYPDHKSPGEFVATHRRTGDILIVEDALVQRWYAGKVDYWLRDYDSHKRFLFKAEDDRLHDMYVNSVAITPDILDYLANIKDQRIWLITSSETLGARDHYLSEEQARWLSTIEENHTPLFTGKDNTTKVYCLNYERTSSALDMPLFKPFAACPKCFDDV